MSEVAGRMRSKRRKLSRGNHLVERGILPWWSSGVLLPKVLNFGELHCRTTGPHGMAAGLCGCLRLWISTTALRYLADVMPAM